MRDSSFSFFLDQMRISRVDANLAVPEDDVVFAVQDEQLGTAHATGCAAGGCPTSTVSSTWSSLGRRVRS